MSRYKVKKHELHSFEAVLSAKIQRTGYFQKSLIMSKAFKDLNANQKILYLIMLQQKNGFTDKKNRPINCGDNCFYFNWRIVQKHGKGDNPSDPKWALSYELYTNHAQFIRDIGALIEHGFFTCEYDGWNQRKKSIYKVSDAWNDWGTNKFRMPSKIPQSLKRKLNRQKRDACVTTPSTLPTETNTF